MAEGANSITKIGIIVVSVILGFFCAYSLFNLINDGRDFGNSDKIIGLVQVGLSLTLCVLAFWGAYTENACLCYITLVFCVILFILGVWSLIQCLMDRVCDTKYYIIQGIILVIYGVMVVAVYLFIQAIK